MARQISTFISLNNKKKCIICIPLIINDNNAVCPFAKQKDLHYSLNTSHPVEREQFYFEVREKEPWSRRRILCAHEKKQD